MPGKNRGASIILLAFVGAGADNMKESNDRALPIIPVSTRLAAMLQPIAGWRALSWILVALATYASARLLPVTVGLSAAGQAVLGVVFAGVVLWISEAVPLGLTALFVLVLLGTVPNAAGSVTFVGFASPVVFFLIGAVAIGTAVEASGLAGRLANVLVRRAGGSPARLYIQMLVSLPGLALLLPSAITRNAVLIPAYRDSLSAMGISQSGRTGRALMLALGVLNPLASSALLTGGITSMTASAIIGDFSWFRWFALMAVPYYTLLCLGGIALRLMVGRFEEQRAVNARPAVERSLSPREARTIAVLVLVSALWLTDFIHGLSPAIPALLGAVLLVCPKIGVLGWKELESRLSWGLVLTVGASLSLSQAMMHAGTAEWLGRSFILMLTGVTQAPLVLLTAIIISVAMVHLAITNLAACIALLVPITMTVAKAAGVNPIVCALAVTIVIDSVILYPVQTAANLVAYESGYFGAADVGRLGLTMLGLTIVVSLCVAVPYWSALGLPLVSG
jgi:solute carrier family 13 (sodium-dependent dicarboxylate transporter), member 2/3/5